MANYPKILGYVKTKQEGLDQYGQIEWYDSTHPTMKMLDDCFSCGGKRVAYMIWELSPGHITGEPICKVHLRYRTGKDHV